MPTSPNSRAGGHSHEGDKTPGDPTSTASSNDGKKDHQTTNGTAQNPNGSDGAGGNQSKRSRRKTMQNLQRRYADLRERAQLAGLIHTEPEGAVRNEKVETKDKPQPKLIETAIRSGWAVPDEIKPELVAEMTAIVTDDSEDTSDKTKVAAFRALLAADQAQHDRDNPQQKKGGTEVNVSVQTNIAAVDVLREALQQPTPIQQIEDK